MSVQVISFNCLLKTKTGAVISSTFNQGVLNTPLGGETLLKGLALGMQDLKAGEQRSISLKAEEAYGLYDPQKVILFPRSKLPKDTKVGMTVNIKGKSGQVRSYKVVQYMDSMARLDGNHPLAGQDLIFEIEALSVRQASEEEIFEATHSATELVLH